MRTLIFFSALSLCQGFSDPVSPGNLLTSGIMTNTWDAANRLIETIRLTDQATNRLNPLYNGVGDRVGQTVGVTTTYFALDGQGLPEVIYTSQGETFLHLPGVIMTESAEGDVRYLLSDGLGSVRQAVDETGAVVAYQAFDPYGNPVENGSEPYGFTGEWWENYSELLYLRARWMMPETGTFLSRDPVEGEPGYLYGRGNPVNLTDASGNSPDCQDDCKPTDEGFWEGKARISCKDITDNGGTMKSYLESEGDAELLTRMAMAENNRNQEDR